MSREQPRNHGAAVNARLLAQARQTREEFQLLLMRFGLERLLYRLSQSEYRDAFVMKGALMFIVWAGEPYRATKDLDLLALQSASRERFRDIFRQLCSTSVVQDGLVLEPDTVTAEDIREAQAYQGVRVKLTAKLGPARIPLQVDIGFGDALTPKPSTAEFPVLLDFPAPRLAMYRRETAIAEKFEAMVHLGMLNSRMKDFYDIWALAQRFDFEGGTLAAAIGATFQRRKTPLPSTVPLAFTPEMTGSPIKHAQWAAFVRRSRLRLATAGFEKVVAAIKDFLEAPQVAASQGKRLRATWAKGGPWRLP